MGYRYNYPRLGVVFIVYLEIDPAIMAVLAAKGRMGFRCIEYTLWGEVDYCTYYGMPRRELTRA